MGRQIKRVSGRYGAKCGIKVVRLPRETHLVYSSDECGKNWRARRRAAPQTEDAAGIFCDVVAVRRYIWKCSAGAIVDYVCDAS